MFKRSLGESPLRSVNLEHKMATAWKYFFAMKRQLFTAQNMENAMLVMVLVRSVLYFGAVAGPDLTAFKRTEDAMVSNLCGGDKAAATKLRENIADWEIRRQTKPN
jgi:hypothetical protein